MTVLPAETMSVSADETRRYGAALVRSLRGGDVVLLVGSLGAGKSELVRGMATALGAVHWRGSPTFNLVHEYATMPPLYHADLYRLGTEDIEELGLEEYARPDAVLAVEWADRAPRYLANLGSTAPIWIVLTYLGGDRRHLAIQRGGLPPAVEATP